MKTKNKLIISTAIMLFISIVFTLLVILVDKQNIGANNSSVGLSGLNKIFKDTFNYNDIFYKISEILGYIVIALALCYMSILLMQFFKRKSIKKIDKDLLLVAIFYLAVVIVYVIFEVAKINFRPILIDGELEASYPSSHTMLSVFICSTAIFINQKLINQKSFRISLNCTIATIGIATIVTRIISGVHWITDIIGAVLISTTLVLGYLTILNIIKTNKTELRSQE